MTGTSYRVAIKPMVPGDKADPANFKILESMPVRSIITSPANGDKIAAGTKELKLRGASWAGDLTVKRVDVSIDYGRDLAGGQARASRRTATTGSAGPRRSSCRPTAITRSGRAPPTPTTSCSRMSPRTGIRTATAAIRCTALRCWSADVALVCNRTRRARCAAGFARLALVAAGAASAQQPRVHAARRNAGRVPAGAGRDETFYSLHRLPQLQAGGAAGHEPPAVGGDHCAHDAAARHAAA